MPASPGIYGFDHMVVRLEDLDQGVAKFQPIMGKAPDRVDEQAAMGLRLAIFNLPNGGYIEVVAPSRKDSVLRPALDKSGPGLNLMAFQCEDLPATVALMKSNGVKVIEGVQTLVSPKSTHGILFQLVEKPASAPKRNKAGQVPDQSGVTGIVSYKCTVIFVADVDEAVSDYEKLGLKLTFKIENKKAKICQAGFFLRGGGLIELIAPLDPKDESNGFVKMIKKRGEGLSHISLDGSAGAVPALNARGVKTIYEDPAHTWIAAEATGVGRPFIQLNPVLMGTPEQVDLGGGPVAKL